MTKLTYWVAGLLVAVLGWIFTITYAKLCAIQTEIVTVQVTITRLQAEMMTEDRVREIIEHEMLKHGIK